MDAEEDAVGVAAFDSMVAVAAVAVVGYCCTLVAREPEWIVGRPTRCPTVR